MANTIIKAGTDLRISAQPNRTYRWNTMDSDNLDLIVSANSPIPIQVEWSGTGVTNNSAIDGTGDVANVVLEIYMGNLFYPASTTWSSHNLASGNMTKIATIKKSRDIIYQHSDVGWEWANNTIDAKKHIFTFDIQTICADLLNYTLCPLGQETISSGAWGGMNGEYALELSGDINPKYPSLGAFRWIDFLVKAEVLDSSGNIVTAHTSTASSSQEKTWNGNYFGIINSALQWTDTPNHRAVPIRPVANSTAAITTNEFLSNCPNFDRGGSESYNKPQIYKKIRIKEPSEFLYFFVGNTFYTQAAGGSPVNITKTIAIEITTDTGDVVRLKDFARTLVYAFYGGTGTTQSEPFWNRYCVQNVSVESINAVAAGTITTSTKWYSAHVTYMTGSSTWTQVSEKRYYSLDHESNDIPFDITEGCFVKFYWLNRKGGIDSYVAKRDVIEGLTVSKNVYERKVGQTLLNREIDDFRFAGGAVVPNTRFPNTTGVAQPYQSSSEVLNLDAAVSNSVTTEPLNKQKAKWLEEIITSPNVWVALHNGASRSQHNDNPKYFPKDSDYAYDYFPIVITSSEVETVNEESGLVTFNIQYTESHKINTQRN